MTPALEAASTRRSCEEIEALLIVETTASWPSRAEVREERDSKSTGLTVTEDGKVWLLVCRVRAVTVKPALRSSERTEGPRLPVACEFMVSF